MDRYVSSHPSSFGLESIPVRGSAGRHIVERETRGRERPPEPQGAPPRRSQPRDRSRSKKKSKGAKHRERGRQFWRSYRQGEQWRRSWGCGPRQRPPDQGELFADPPPPRPWTEERSSKKASGSRRSWSRGCRSQMEPRRYRTAARDELRSAPRRGAHSAGGGFLLSSALQGCRELLGGQPPRGARLPQVEAEWDPVQGAPEASYWASLRRDQGACVPGRVQSRGSSRGPHPHQDPTEDEARVGGGRVGSELGEGSAHGTRRGRARDVAEEGQGAVPKKKGKEEWSRQEREERQPRQRLRREESQRQERGKEKEEEKEAVQLQPEIRPRQGESRWDAVKEGSTEGVASTFCRDGAGLQGQSPQSCGTPWPPPHEEEERQDVFKQQRNQLREEQQEPEGRGRRGPLFIGIEGADPGRELPGSSHEPRHHPNEGHTAPGDWAPRSSQYPVPGGGGILPTAPSEEGHWPHAERAPDLDSRPRSSIAGPCRQRGGYSHSESKVDRADPAGQPLDSGAAVGGSSAGLCLHNCPPGSPRGTERSLFGGAAEVAVECGGWSPTPERRQGRRQESGEGPRTRFRSRSQRRQEKRRKRRFSQEERQLRSMQESRDAGADAPVRIAMKMVSEEIAKARASALGKHYEGGSNQPKGSYEGGTAMASSSRTLLGAPLLHSVGDASARAQQSLHVAQTSTSEERIRLERADDCGLTGPGLSPTGYAMTSQTSCESAGKKNALSDLSGETSGYFGFCLLQQLLEVLPLRSQPIGRRDPRSFFPLPSSRSSLEYAFPGLDEHEIAWLRCVCLALNSYWGGDLDGGHVASPGQRACLESLVKDVGRLCTLTTPLERISWDELFRVRSVDYQGEEVKVAQWFSWKNIAPALPREVGRVELTEVCELGCKFYVDHFESYLKPPEERVRTKAPRVMVDDAAWPEVCVGLRDSNVCCFLEESEVFHLGDVPLLNGMFGVSKDETSADGHEVFRLIMNLIPLNNIL